MKTVLQTMLIGIVLLNFGCKEETTINNAPDTLNDPAVMPKVIFTYPANNSVGPYNGLYVGSSSYYNTPHFRIQFNKIMNSATLYYASNNISISGFDESTFWDISTNGYASGIYEFYLRGGNSYEPLFYRLGEKYTVTISGDVEDIHGNKLGQQYSFSFTMESTFRVVSALPKDSISANSSQISLAFNSQIDSSILSSISISPELPGYWSFGSSRNLLYYTLSSSFVSNTTYTITIAGGAKDKFGIPIAAPYSHSFKSGEFKMLRSSPDNNYVGFGLNNQLSFVFSSAVQLSSVQSAFTIDPYIGGQFSTYSGYLYFTPSEPLKEKTSYVVTISTDLAATNGSKLTVPYTVNFTTEGFRLNQIYPYYSSEVSRYTNIEVTCNAPINTSTVADGFSISPAVAGKIYFSSKNTKFVFRPDSSFQARTGYVVSLFASLKSAAGNQLESEQSSSFTTGD